MINDSSGVSKTTDHDRPEVVWRQAPQYQGRDHDRPEVVWRQAPQGQQHCQNISGDWQGRTSLKRHVWCRLAVSHSAAVRADLLPHARNQSSRSHDEHLLADRHVIWTHVDDGRRNHGQSLRMYISFILQCVVITARPPCMQTARIKPLKPSSQQKLN